MPTHENVIEHIGMYFIELLSTDHNKLFEITDSLFNFSVNSAFVSLRHLIPTEPKTRKLSKIETLRLAKSYIEHLFAMLITGINTINEEELYAELVLCEFHAFEIGFYLTLGQFQFAPHSQCL